jgi:heptosyltransferase-2
VVIDVYAKISSAMITKFSGAKMRIGYQKNYTSFLYTHTFQRLKKPEHDASLALENRLKLLKPLGIDFDFITPKIYLTPEEVSTARNSLDKSGLNLELPLVMVSILGSNPKKTYPGSFMAELLDFCVEKKQGIQFLFNYIPNQKTEVKAIYKQLNPVTQNQVFFDIFGKSLREYMALTARCTAVFGNEGGANNIAKALEIPTFSIFSPNLTKVNWFGKSEEKKHTAVHLADYMDFNKNDKKAAVENPELYYAKFKPELIKPELERFLSEVSKL